MPRIIGIQGPYGAGKTLSATVLGTMWAYQAGAQLMSNYAIQGAYLFQDYTDWYTVAALHGSIIVFDEGQTDWDAREWGGKAQINRTKIMNYVRKMNSCFIFVLPSFNNAESRVRDMCEVLIDVKRNDKGTMVLYIYDYQAKQYGSYGKLINVKKLPYSKQQEIFKLNLYDTDQMVKSFPMPTSDKEFKKFMEQLDRVHRSAVQRVKPDKPTIKTITRSELGIDFDVEEEHQSNGNQDKSKPVAIQQTRPTSSQHLLL